MTGPRKAFHRFRNERLDHDVLGYDAAHELCRQGLSGFVNTEQRFGRDGQIAKRCGYSPRAQFRAEHAQSGQRQLDLRSAFRGEQFVPLVDHDATQIGKDRRTVFATEQKRQ